MKVCVLFMYIGGLDIGTTGCKLTVYDENGLFIFNSYREYNVSRKCGEHELDGNSVFESVKSVIKETTKNIGDIDALGVTSFGESFVLLDENDNILMPSMLYTDARGYEESKKFDDSYKYICGVKPNLMFSLPKLMWIKNNMPQLYSKVKRVLLYQDFIVYMLCSVAQIDYSVATRTMGFDLKNKCWSEEIFKTAQIDIALMSTPVKSGTVAGIVKKNDLGLVNTIIVSGCHDQVAASVGAGIFESTTAIDGCGTVECVTPVFEKIPTIAKIYDCGYAIVPYILDGKYVCYSFAFTGGALIKWYRDTFENTKSYKELDYAIKDEPSGLLILPHFAGAATPYMDNSSKGAIVGITLETTKEDIYKALMESVAYEMLVNIEILESCGIDIEVLYATGGGANSEKWVQIKADILNKKIISLDAPEVGAVGTIMLTGVSVGAFESVNSASKLMVKEKKTFVPSEKRHMEYMKHYEKYKKLYQTIKPLI